VLSPAAVLIENGRSRSWFSDASEAHAAGVKTIDLGSSTLLPGLIDSHTHLLLDIIVPQKAKSHATSMRVCSGVTTGSCRSPTKRVLLGAQLAREDLESGFTTIRNLGHSGIDGDAALRDAINAAAFPARGCWHPDVRL